MKQADKDALIEQVDAGLVLITSSSRPSAATINKAEKIFKGVRVACQNIPITPDTVDPGQPPVIIDPGPGNPPVDQGPVDPGTSPPDPTTITTTYTSIADFGGVQGFRGWYYLSENETELNYSAGTQQWTGTETYQGIWSTGQHPGGTNGAMRRWVAQGTGTFAITGQIYDQDTASGGGNDVTVSVLKNGVAIYSQVITAGDGTGYALNLTGSCFTDDEFDFLVEGNGGLSFASTGMNLSIALTTASTSGGGNPTQTTLPFTLNGTAPQEGTYSLTANKPANADTCTISITGVNYDTAYGRIYFNGSTNSMAIWPVAPGNTGISATVVLTVPVSYLLNGSNSLRFTHDSGSGYTVTAIAAPVFTTIADPTPPADQTALPFVLTGAILPEAGTITLNVTKPSNANGATITVTGVNLTEEMGAYSINGTQASLIWSSNPSNAGVSATVVRSPLHTLFVNGANTIRFTHTSGSGYTVTAVSVAFSTQPLPDPEPPVGNNGTFQREPAGMTTLLNHSFSTVTGPNMNDWYNSTQIVNDPTAPLSPPNVAMHRLGALAREGGGELSFRHPTIYREWFVGFYWRTNPQFQGRTGGNKLFFVRGPDSIGVFVIQGGLASGSGPLLFSHNSSSLDNSHICGGDSIGTLCFATSGGGIVQRGVWTKIEANIRASTTNTSRDGIVRWWINGVPAGNYTTINYAAAGLNEWIWNETWDGCGGNPGCDLGQVNTAPWEHYIDHLYISGKN